ncbi:hypothetical protein BJ508DRAFT_306487 [Ascobolus immersus RN42]|uniref:F-box domain-containing protein n=1 Tax=Ascobolus immersus RN42 TaxID=1160509 RepID=A0A3N4I7J1_ASCIM|nr:hypothetical protein BJ508DRAFT_306487 [Ascobolus immersus RN42]
MTEPQVTPYRTITSLPFELLLLITEDLASHDVLSLSLLCTTLHPRIVPILTVFTLNRTLNPSGVCTIDPEVNPLIKRLVLTVPVLDIYLHMYDLNSQHFVQVYNALPSLKRVEIDFCNTTLSASSQERAGQRGTVTETIQYLVEKLVTPFLSCRIKHRIDIIVHTNYNGGKLSILRAQRPKRCDSRFFGEVPYNGSNGHGQPLTLFPGGGLDPYVDSLYSTDRYFGMYPKWLSGNGSVRVAVKFRPEPTEGSANVKESLRYLPLHLFYPRSTGHPVVFSSLVLEGVRIKDGTTGNPNREQPRYLLVAQEKEGQLKIPAPVGGVDGFETWRRKVGRDWE